jgi:hypothetical protein
LTINEVLAQVAINQGCTLVQHLKSHSRETTMAKTKFTLSEEDQQKLVEWLKQQATKGTTRDCTGFRYVYCYAPTSLEDYFWVEDKLTGDKLHF